MNIPLSLFDRFGSDRYALAFIELIRLSDEKGNVHQTEREIAEITGWSKSFVHRVILKASNMGAIKVKKTSGEPSVNQARIKKQLISICGIAYYKTTEPSVNQARIKKQQKTYTISDNNLFSEEELKAAEKYPFEKVWDLYDYKKSKKTAEIRWNNMAIKDRKAAMNFIPTYVALTTKGYRQLLATFLNKRTWEDEVISTGGFSVDVKNFNANLLDYPNLFRNFVSHFNNMVKGTKISPVDLENGLTEDRRVMFNIAYCLSFDKTKLVMEKVLKSPRLNGTKGFAASYDFIFNPKHFQEIYEGVYDI